MGLRIEIPRAEDAVLNPPCQSDGLELPRGQKVSAQVPHPAHFDFPSSIRRENDFLTGGCAVAELVTDVLAGDE